MSERIWRGRSQQGWTQVELTRRLDVTVTTISRWERGSMRPRFHARTALAAVFGQPAVWFVDREAPPRRSAAVGSAATRIAHALAEFSSAHR